MDDIELPDLPRDSLLDANDYREMYRIASSDVGFDVMYALETYNAALPESGLVQILNHPVDDVNNAIQDLTRVALVKAVRGPDIKRVEYQLSELGETVVGADCVADGIQELAQEDTDLKDRYTEF